MTASAKEEKNTPAARKVAGDLFCTGETQYRIGNGPLLTGNVGHLPVSLPIQVSTKQDNCRLLLPGCGLFELGPQSSMRLDRTQAGQLQMSVTQGSVAYSLPDGVSLKVSEPSGRQAQAGQLSAKPSKKFAHTGIARVVPNKFFEISNLAGKLAVVEKGGALVDVALANVYRFGGTEEPGAPVWRVSPGSTAFDSPTAVSNQTEVGSQRYTENARPSSSPH